MEFSHRDPDPLGYTINPVRTPTDLSAVISLFTAYATSLGIDLSFQRFDEEMRFMPGKYAPPAGGELLLARRTTDGAAIGCVGLRALDESDSASESESGSAASCCEMKRLYVNPEGRGLGVGAALVDAVIVVARERGYREMRLDTLPSMKAAVALYERRGFERIEKYYETPIEGTIFLSKIILRARNGNGVEGARGQADRGLSVSVSCEDENE